MSLLEEGESFFSSSFARLLPSHYPLAALDDCLVIVGRIESTKLTLILVDRKTVLIYNSATGGTLPYLTDPTGIQVGGLKRADGLRLLALWVANKETSMTFPVRFAPSLLTSHD